MAYSKEHYLAHKAEYAAKSRAWREANPERSKENRRKYYEANKDKELSYSTSLNRFRKTGVSAEQYQKQHVLQKGLCAICSGTCSKALAADHDHVTGLFRGLLCNNCNRALGHFKDSPELLLKAVEYLKGTYV